MLDRHSLFWKLAILLVGFCLLMIGLSYTWGRHMETQNAFLDAPARQVLRCIYPYRQRVRRLCGGLAVPLRRRALTGQGPLRGPSPASRR